MSRIRTKRQRYRAQKPQLTVRLREARAPLDKGGDHLEVGGDVGAPRARRLIVSALERLARDHRAVAFVAAM